MSLERGTVDSLLTVPLRFPYDLLTGCSDDNAISESSPSPSSSSSSLFSFSFLLFLFLLLLLLAVVVVGGDVVIVV